MTVHVDVSPDVLSWAEEVSSTNPDQLRTRFKRWDAWLSGDARPTIKQVEQIASATGVPFGYLLLPRPPQLRLPIADFREGVDANLRDSSPSANLLAVVNQSLSRQAWYREYAVTNDLPTVSVVGTGRSRTSVEVASDIREHLNFEVSQRKGDHSDTRKALLRGFENLGGLSVATSMVGNNRYRQLDPDEFRGFSLVDDYAPLIFVNAAQTLNGQIFTLAHELGHIWLGQSGISNEDTSYTPSSNIERWCNQVASEVLVPQDDLVPRLANIEGELTDSATLDRLAHVYRCGTLVVLLAMRRDGVVNPDRFEFEYDRELRRLRLLSKTEKVSGGGNHYSNQPFRVGDRLSRALISDALEGNTPISEALSLMSMKSLSTFDEYARRLGVA